jgi:hypothetical protein
MNEWCDPEWWLPLSTYRNNARATCEAKPSCSFREARRIYRMARSGVIFTKIV